MKLSSLEKKDIYFVLDIRKEVNLYMGKHEFANRQQQEEWFKRICSDDTIKAFIIKEKASRIGYAILNYINYIHRRCYAQVQIQKKFRNRGYGTRAFKQLLEIAFGILGMNKVCLETFENNKRAERVYKKLGFKTEGIFKEHYWKAGGFVTALQMYILRGDFHGIHKRTDLRDIKKLQKP